MKQLSLENYFKACSYLLFVVGFATLVFTGKVDTVSIVLYGLALILSWSSDQPQSRLQISPNTANILAVAFLGFVYVDWRLLSQSFIGPLIHYGLFISTFNLFKVKTDRDWVFLYLITIFQVLLAATLTIDITFIAMLVVFVLVALATLEAFEIKRSRSEVDLPQEERLLSRWGQIVFGGRVGYLVTITFVMVALIAVIAAPIFLLLPRANAGFMAQQFGTTTVSLTGFSDIVELGDVTNIKKNSEVVMNVRVKNADGKPAPIGKKWRGVTLSSYDGKRWRDMRQYLRGPVRPQGGRYQIATPRAGGEILEQTFYIEPLNTPVVFVATEPLVINDKIPVLYRLRSDALMTDDHSYRQISYTVYSNVALPPLNSLRQDEGAYPKDFTDSYLQLPDIDSRIRELTRQITATAKSRLEKAQLLERYLKTTYGYTLNLQRTSEADPIADFLFNIKAGHCEYFASSMVLMLRSIGVAARIVNGFQPGEYNEVSGTYTVRQSDAHSWVEVYFPENDYWMEFDPTPAVGLSQYTNTLSNQVNKYFAAIRLLWVDYVVAYDSQRQSYLASSIQQTVLGYKQQAESWQSQLRRSWQKNYAKLPGWNNPTVKYGLLASLVLLVGAAITLGRLDKLLLQSPQLLSGFWGMLLLPLLRWQSRHSPQQSAVLFYNEMLALVQRRLGREKLIAETPLEFAVATNLPAVAVITNYYNQVRYSETALNPQEWQQVNQALQDLRRQPRVKRPPMLPPLYRWVAIGLMLTLVSGTLFIDYRIQQGIVRYSRQAQSRIEAFKINPLSEPSAKMLAATLQKVRINRRDGTKFFNDAFRELPPEIERTFSRQALGWGLPWEDQFKPERHPIGEQGLSLFLRREILSLEQAGACISLQETFVKDVSQRADEAISYSINLQSRTDVMLWKAYFLMRIGQPASCLDEIKRVLSLGAFLQQSTNPIVVLDGYRLLVRAAFSLAKFYELNEDPEAEEQWRELAKEAGRNFQAYRQLLSDLGRFATTDATLEELEKIIANSPVAIGRAVITAVGENWIYNPRHAILGMSQKRQQFLTKYSQSTWPELSQAAKSAQSLAQSKGWWERIEILRSRRRYYPS
jgi:protein-glutamine gamma-glutamyltransferase